MNRRHFLLSGLALGLVGLPGAAHAQARFTPTRFSVRTVGQGPDVILIPGLTAGPEVWAETVAANPNHRFHLLHVAGFAGAAAGGNARGPVVSPLADEIARYIETRGLRRTAIVGHSMGGTLGMILALRRPDLVGRLMVVDMLPQPAGLFGGSAMGWSPLARALGGLMQSEGGRSVFAGLMRAFSPPDAGHHRSDASVVGRAMQELIATDLTPHLGRIRAPMTVVYASPDARARAAMDRQFATAYANARAARLVRIDDSGHMVMQDQPGRFLAALRGFLAR